jgi:hypothetical protein
VNSNIGKINTHVCSAPEGGPTQAFPRPRRLGYLTSKEAPLNLFSIECGSSGRLIVDNERLLFPDFQVSSMVRATYDIICKGSQRAYNLRVQSPKLARVPTSRAMKEKRASKGADE